MKLVRIYEYGGPEVLKIEDAEKPSAGKNEVVIEVHAIGVNYAEIQQRKGIYPFPISLPSVMGQWAVVAGTIVEIGEGVQSLHIGAYVIAQVPSGAYAEYVVVPEYLLVPAPQGISPEQATTLLTQGQTAFHTLMTAGKMQTGETVLIHAAAGGVGSLAIQIAKACGAGIVIATAGSSEKRSLTLELGADYAIDYNDPDWSRQVMDIAGWKGPDLILDSAGGVILESSLKILAPFGRLVYYGSASARSTSWDQAELVDILANKTIIGFNIAHLLESNPNHAKTGIESLFSLIASGRVKPIVQHILPLEDVAMAHQLIESRQTVGTLVLKPSSLV
ncbi:quinone oxidoreductase family protein [Paenibacillus fonticola]|uniref:quinone oxidoreductase family protein n=1 Tax=Paenibacillus fonticola TaxID=379896 RepID=UPI000362BD2D|nr:zinc-binding dehydrogenase [Paenibacillus fonticola]